MCLLSVVMADAISLLFCPSSVSVVLPPSFPAVPELVILPAVHSELMFLPAVQVIRVLSSLSFLGVPYSIPVLNFSLTLNSFLLLSWGAAKYSPCTFFICPLFLLFLPFPCGSNTNSFQLPC